MRVPIAVQLALLVLLTSVVGIAVLAIATVSSPVLAKAPSQQMIYHFAQWITTYNFVVDVG